MITDFPFNFYFGADMIFLKSEVKLLLSATVKNTGLAPRVKKSFQSCEVDTF